MQEVLVPFIFPFHCFLLSYFSIKMHCVLLLIVIKKKEMSQINYSPLSICVAEPQLLLF